MEGGAIRLHEEQAPQVSRRTGRGKSMQIQIGGAEGDGGEVHIRAIGKNDDGETVFGEALDDGMKAYGASIVPHARVTAIRIEEPAEAVIKVLAIGGGFGQVVHRRR